MKTNKSISLDELKDRFIGEKKSLEREQYELDLSLDVIGQFIKETRLKKNLTQAQLGELVGVQKAQISKLESNTKNVTLATILKVFRAMEARVKLNVEINSAA